MKRCSLVLLLLSMLILVSGPPVQARDTLTADTTFHVNKNGSDSNDCSAEDALHACLTIQHGVEVVQAKDLSNVDATLQIGDGIYSENVFVSAMVGSGGSVFTIKGNSADPDSVTISPASGVAVWIESLNLHWIVLDGMKLTADIGLYSRANSWVKIKNLDFGYCANRQIYLSRCSLVEAIGNYSISGGSQWHVYIEENSWMEISNYTITISAPVTFSSCFIQCLWNCSFLCNAVTFVNKGNVTGKRYYAARNGVIDSNGNGPAYLPGTINGTADTGGQYI